MYFKRRLTTFLCFTVLCTLLFACSDSAQHIKMTTIGNGEKLDPAQQQQAQAQQQEQEQQHAQQAQDNDDTLPMLKGGAEKDQRELIPASNAMLQTQFPQTLVLRGSLSDPRIALTFDDGPDRRFTPKVLDVLKKHDVKATFFLMGSRVRGLPIITKRIDEEGHAIGNHTYWHPKLYEESAERLWWEVHETEKVIDEIVGYKPKLFRAPYGGLNASLLSSLADMELSVVGWSVDSLDWQGLSAKEVENNVLGHTVPGSIILMHSGGHWTQDLSGMVEALDAIIPKLKEQGLQFVTVAELLNISDRR